LGIISKQNFSQTAWSVQITQGGGSGSGWWRTTELKELAREAREGVTAHAEEVRVRANKMVTHI